MSALSSHSQALSVLRTTPINFNHWYVVAQAGELGQGPLGVILWEKPIAIYRDQEGQVRAVEDRCPHRQVKLSEGKVLGNNLECAYHGWQFDTQGHCTKIPYFSKAQKLPPCRLRTYPVQEKDGFIWLYPGDLDYLANHGPAPLAIPEWHHLNYIGSFAAFDCPGHFSYLIENLMDMHHGHLHDNYQAWASASLRQIETNGDRVVVDYDAQSYYKIDKIWSISQLFFPALRRLHPENLRVSYIYPHWSSTLGADFKIYCLFCPVSPNQTKAYLVHFTSLEAFPKLHKLPIAFRSFLKNWLSGTARPLLEGLIDQDIRMITQEQAAFEQNPDRQNVEVNPALAKVQQLIRQQALASESA
ncbi:aromatic ring-hydroxylating dioxygenase subunit alpha [Synechocystis sp. FACHB-383]|uniref:aromatic ring-hydroxylating dioxygenase subunit alpha n=1 Tax=Synechocystis sp. FACHB-383 TaxID=2692864 RepID=UPI0016887AB4|nr:aromatic ring-hydroxylating dioxygenase subunit alpha [Synechocystis sp. FACHB-383]MBD2652239.1 aromatic ring-hydroxylating dioxygenase subunit alpha [Synechocystis sp. FACHB-383]